jgi:hypothetical protein
MSSRLARQLAQAANALHETRTPFALIGGMALASHGVVRGTHDIDFLVEATAAAAIDAMLTKLGYEARHRSENAATYVRDDERDRASLREPADRDPYRALDDLMEVLEVLCPRWPPRPVARGDDYRL